MRANYNSVTPANGDICITTVIPAKAGIQGGRLRRILDSVDFEKALLIAQSLIEILLGFSLNHTLNYTLALQIRYNTNIQTNRERRQLMSFKCL